MRELYNEGRHCFLKYRHHDVVDWSSGYGSLFYRSYSCEFSSKGSPESIIQAIRKDVNIYLNPRLAWFKDSPQILETGAEYMIRIQGPWNGPVLLSHTEKFKFVLLTRNKHMEAGIIQFSACLTKNKVRFEISSLARCQDFLSWVLYEPLGLNRYFQYCMWRDFLLRVAKNHATFEQEIEILDVTKKISWKVFNEMV